MVKAELIIKNHVQDFGYLEQLSNEIKLGFDKLPKEIAKAIKES